MVKDNRTKIVFEYEGVEYTLVFSADSLLKMEKTYGIKFAKMEDRVLSIGEDLFIGAFIAEHPNVSIKKRKEIYRSLCETADGTSDSLNETLMEMLNEAIESIKPKGNVTWKVERSA